MRPKPNRFWRDYMAGKFKTLSALVAARQRQVAETYLDASAPKVSRYEVPLIFRRKCYRHKTYFQSEQYLAQQARADWQNTNPLIRKFAGAYIAELRKQGLPFFVLTAFRTPEQQAKEKSEGDSKLGGIRAPHVQGKAVDIVHSVMPYKLTDAEYLQLGELGKKVAQELGIMVTWGGDFGRKHPQQVGWDPAHWELADWRDEIVTPQVGEPILLTATQLAALSR